MELKMASFLIFHIIHPTIATLLSNNLDCYIFSKDFNREEVIDLTEPSCSFCTLRPKSTPNHTLCVQLQPNNMCSTDSSLDLQMMHNGDGAHFLLNKFSYFAKALEHALHKKCLTSGIVSSFQIISHSFGWGCEDDSSFSL